MDSEQDRVPTREDHEAAERAAAEHARQMENVGEPAPVLPPLPSGEQIPEKIQYY